jgi:predicted PurR-regulated permease PerM
MLTNTELLMRHHVQTTHKENPQKPVIMNSSTQFSGLSRGLITLAAVILILAGMKAASSFLAPLLFSLFLAVIFGMLLHWFEKKGLSPRLALISTVGVFLAIMAVFIIVIAGSFLQILSELPRYQHELEKTLEPGNPLLSISGLDLSSLTVQDLIQSLSSQAAGMIVGITNVIGISVIILVTTLFLIFEARGFTSKLQQIIEEYRPGDLNRFTTLAQKNVDYIIIRTKVNLAMGAGVAIILAVLGVKYAVFWGFLAFLLGFIPYIGFWLAVIPPMLIAWVSLGPVYALLVLAGSALVNFLAEYIMFPSLAGRGLELSAAAVFISLLFWGYILGGIGVLIAVPLTLFVQLICELSEETRWVSVLLGPSV